MSKRLVSYSMLPLAMLLLSSAAPAQTEITVTPGAYVRGSDLAGDALLSVFTTGTDWHARQGRGSGHVRYNSDGTAAVTWNGEAGLGRWWWAAGSDSRLCTEWESGPRAGRTQCYSVYPKLLNGETVGYTVRGSYTP